MGCNIIFSNITHKWWVHIDILVYYVLIPIIKMPRLMGTYFSMYPHPDKRFIIYYVHELEYNIQ